MSRFYLPDGTTIEGLRAARKHDDASVSVTTVLEAWPKPWLQNYKVRQTLEAALTLPRNEGEALDDYAQRVLDDAEAHAKVGRDRGSTVHEIILRGGKLDESDLALPAVKTWADWQPRGERTVWTERVLFGQGYAGRADRLQLSSERLCYFLDDFKIRETARVYDEDKLQLAAYLEALPIEYWVHTRPRSIVLQADGNNIIVKEWSDDELADAFTAFTRCRMVWCTANNYWPTSPVPTVQENKRYQITEKAMAKILYGNLAPQLT